MNTKILDYLGATRKSLSIYPLANIISAILPGMRISEVVSVASDCIDFFSSENLDPAVLIVYPDIVHVIHGDLSTEIYIDVLDSDNTSFRDSTDISIVNVPDFSQVLPMFKVNTGATKLHQENYSF